MEEGSTRQQKRITESAVKLFREMGYERTSVSDICREAGIARSTFYLNFAGKRGIIHKVLSDARLDQNEFFGEFVAAANDFERMWILCNRYLSVAVRFGPELTGALFRLELTGEIDILNVTHKVDEWMIRLAANSQKAGVIRSSVPAEQLAPLGVDIAYYSTYEWCKRRGDYDLRQVVRRREETLYDLAPECRMSGEALAKL